MSTQRIDAMSPPALRQHVAAQLSRGRARSALLTDSLDDAGEHTGRVHCGHLHEAMGARRRPRAFFVDGGAGERKPPIFTPVGGSEEAGLGILTM